jgi:ubiquinone/menaquinone biosynthesis C-methylase UbiE
VKNGDLIMDENLALLYEMYTGVPRAGPGSKEAITRAFTILQEIPAQPKILDIGCGPGMQTIELAKISPGKIVALDIYQPFLDLVMRNAEEAGVASRVKTVNQSMFDMDFERESFDIIWAESSIFIMGFEKALGVWGTFLKSRGYLVVSELVWFEETPPEDLKVHWEAEYPGMQTHKDNLRVIEKLGYRFIDSFVVSEEDWLYFYDLLEPKIDLMREKYKGNEAANMFLDLSQKEIELFRKYSKYYGFIFYMIQKV